MSTKDSAPKTEFTSHAPDLSRREFKVHVGVDFGTDGVGLAYAFPGDEQVLIHSKWKTLKYSVKVKPKTIVLLDENNKAIQFGLDAKYYYMMQSGSNMDKLMLFERFKMSLYPDKYNENLDQDDGKKANEKIAIEQELTAVNGKKVKSSIVFIEVFKYLEKQAIQYLKIKLRGVWKNIQKSDIQWIVTVPAIWNDKAKYQMRQWIIDAGLVDELIEDHCKIVYEPDCASLSIQHEIIKNKSAKQSIHNITNEEDEKQTHFADGEKYILIDAGGGTVDVACHEILGTCGAKEVFHPSGGPWGSCYIDDQFVKLLQDIFSKEWMEEFRLTEFGKTYIELLHNFQASKENFSGEETSHNVELPLDFVTFMQDKLEEKNDGIAIDRNDDVEMNDFVSSFRDFGINSVLLEELSMKLCVEVWKSMFDYVINPTINHVNKLLHDRKLRKCKYLCLVGGLSSSTYFQSRMREEFGSKSGFRLEVIIPERPILSVVEGAALFGITDNYIKARVLRYTYGESMHFGVGYAEDMDVPSDWIDDHKTYDEEMDEWIVENCFEAIARKNEEIYSGVIKTNTGRRSRPTQIHVFTDIMYSNLVNPKTVKDGIALGRIVTEFNNKDKSNMELTLEFHFDETLIKVVTYPTNTPNNKQTRYITNYK